MKRKYVCSFVLIVIAIAGGGISAAAQSSGESEVFQRVNRERMRARLGGLAWDERLAKLARDYSRQMAREGFFDHFDPAGRDVMDRAESARLKNWSSIGENLFFCDEHPYFASTAIRGWMKSRTHRDNILARDWTATGVGIATGRDGGIFITQVFTSK